MLHNHLSTLKVVDIAAGLTRFQQAAHLFGFRGERETCEDLKRLSLARDVDDLAFLTTTLNQAHTDFVSKLDKGNFIRTRGFKLWLYFSLHLLSFIFAACERSTATDVSDFNFLVLLNVGSDRSGIYRCHIVTNSKSSHQISQYFLLFTTLDDHLAIALVVIGGHARISVTGALDHFKHISCVIFKRELAVFKENLSTNHIVLSQSSCLVGDKELDAAELFRNV